jgi:hypothetical protein
VTVTLLPIAPFSKEDAGQSDVHVDGVVGAVKPFRVEKPLCGECGRKHVAGVPCYRKEAAGHPFRGNQFVGGITSPNLGANQWLESGAKEYSSQQGINRAPLDFSKVKVDTPTAKRIAAAYNAAPEHDPKADAAYSQMAKEIEQQYDYATKVMGVKIDTVDHDPYPTVQDMQHDLVANHHISALATSVTGPHPFFTDEQNDKFRAVHDMFGHAATGRGFDRHGEEAAWLSHSMMFSPLARQAMTTETRGQNSVLTQERSGFPVQKVALLPKEFMSPPKDRSDMVKVKGMSLLGGFFNKDAIHESPLRNCIAGRAQLDRMNMDGLKMLPIWKGDGEWDSSKHPRGQPGNAGEFGNGGGGIKLGDIGDESGNKPSAPGAWSPAATKDTQDGIALVHNSFPNAPRINRVLHNPDQSATGNKSNDSITVNSQFLDDAAMAKREKEFNGLMVPGGNTRKAVIAHEYAHVLDGHLASTHPALAKKLDAFLNEPVSYEVNGKTISPPRFQAGTYGEDQPPSPYASESRYEYVAEALTDDMLNGDAAKPTSKKVAAIFHEAYGSPSVAKAPAALNAPLSSTPPPPINQPIAGGSKFADVMTQNPDGFTVDPHSGDDITTGYSVALDNALSQHVPATAKRSQRVKAARDYAAKVRYASATNPSVKFGGWFDSKNNQFTMDHVEIYPHTPDGLAAATSASGDRDQQAIFDIDNKVEIPIGGTGGLKTDDKSTVAKGAGVFGFLKFADIRSNRDRDYAGHDRRGAGRDRREVRRLDGRARSQFGFVKAEWDESKHPRGQPGNAGEFGPGGGGTGSGGKSGGGGTPYNPFASIAPGTSTQESLGLIRMGIRSEMDAANKANGGRSYYNSDSATPEERRAKAHQRALEDARVAIENGSTPDVLDYKAKDARETAVRMVGNEAYENGPDYHNGRAEMYEAIAAHMRAGGWTLPKIPTARSLKVSQTTAKDMGKLSVDHFPGVGESSAGEDNSSELLGMMQGSAQNAKKNIAKSISQRMFAASGADFDSGLAERASMTDHYGPSMHSPVMAYMDPEAIIYDNGNGSYGFSAPRANSGESPHTKGEVWQNSAGDKISFLEDGTVDGGVIGRTVEKEGGKSTDSSDFKRINARLLDGPSGWKQVKGPKWNQSKLFNPAKPPSDAVNFAKGGTPEAIAIMREAGVSSLVNQWAQTSNDSNDQSLAMQQAAKDEFKLEGTADWGEGDTSGEEYGKNGAMYRGFLRAQYDETQQFLKKNNMNELTIWRGIKGSPDDNMAEVDEDGANKGDAIPYYMRPLSSWACESDTPRGFGDTILKATIPANRVLSCSLTGNGCLGEHEVVPLGGYETVGLESDGWKSGGGESLDSVIESWAENSDQSEWAHFDDYGGVPDSSELDEAWNESMDEQFTNELVEWAAENHPELLTEDGYNLNEAGAKFSESIHPGSFNSYYSDIPSGEELNEAFTSQLTDRNSEAINNFVSSHPEAESFLDEHYPDIMNGGKELTQDEVHDVWQNHLEGNDAANSPSPQPMGNETGLFSETGPSTKDPYRAPGVEGQSTTPIGYIQIGDKPPVAKATALIPLHFPR